MPQVLKPVFVPKARRETALERERLEREEKEREHKRNIEKVCTSEGFVELRVGEMRSSVAKCLWSAVSLLLACSACNSAAGGQ